MLKTRLQRVNLRIISVLPFNILLALRRNNKDMKGRGNRVNCLQLLEQCLWSLDRGLFWVLVEKRLLFADFLSISCPPLLAIKSHVPCGPSWRGITPQFLSESFLVHQVFPYRWQICRQTETNTDIIPWIYFILD